VVSIILYCFIESTIDQLNFRKLLITWLEDSLHAGRVIVTELIICEDERLDEVGGLGEDEVNALALLNARVGQQHVRASVLLGPKKAGWPSWPAFNLDWNFVYCWLK